jgi:hypothetical protein
MKNKRRLLELGTASAALGALGLAVSMDQPVDWRVVVAFGLFVILAENTVVLLHPGTGISPSFMLVMAAVALLSHRDPHYLTLSAGLVGLCGGIDLHHLRERRFRIVVYNCCQFLLASIAAGFVFQHLDRLSGIPLLGLAVASSFAFAVINVALVAPYVALRAREPVHAVWNDMRPALPNYLTFGLLGVLIGWLGAELGPVSVLLLAVPMAIGRWTFRSFERVRNAHDASINLFIRLIEAKDTYTARHTERVARFACYIAQELRLPPQRIEHLRESALMHDVGKLAIPSHLLNKPDKLTAHEFELVRRHNDVGLGMLSIVHFMRDMAVTASDRHGRYGEHAGSVPADLVLEAHIVAVADAFDAMTSTRSYRQALDHDVALEELRRRSGTQFNPVCTDALIAALERRGERYGAGHETDVHPFAVPPPVAGVGSAGLGDLRPDDDPADEDRRSDGLHQQAGS